MEDSAPFFGYSFLEPAQGDGSESLGRGGGHSKGPARRPSSTSPRRFSSMRKVC